MNSLHDAFVQFPYPSYPRAATAPDRLAAVARLFAASTPDPEKARVLEVGCSDGGNLLSLAMTAPQGSFFGFDFNESAIARGQARIRELNLSNIELRVLDLSEFPAETGTFDYIIAHGVFSWVAAPLREKLFALIRRHLAPEGVAYVDYNAQPGSQVRYAFRESIQYHVRRFSTAQQRIDQARAFMKLIVEAAPEGSPQRTTAEAELRRLLRAPDTAIFHDLLGVENQPFYFHEFVSAAARHQLEYLGEANVFDMTETTLPVAVRERLAGLTNLVEKEQYLDILKGRVFRQTLLCHAGRSISRGVNESTLQSLYFSASAAATPGSQEGEVCYRYEFGTLRSADAMLKAILDRLAKEFPARLSAGDLANEVRTRHPDLVGRIETEFLRVLLYATMSGIAEIHARPGQFTTAVSPKPVASALARLQAQQKEDLFTLNLKSPEDPDEKLRRILPLLDGTRDLTELTNSLGWPQVEVEAQLQAAAKHALLAR